MTQTLAVLMDDGIETMTSLMPKHSAQKTRKAQYKLSLHGGLSFVGLNGIEGKQRLTAAGNDCLNSYAG
jgi:hypothetical protein